MSLPESSINPAMSPIVELLATPHYRRWVAEQAGHLIGHARSILMGDVLELTEFFVLPGAQSAGVGQAWLAQVFPASGPDFKRPSEKMMSAVFTPPTQVGGYRCEVR